MSILSQWAIQAEAFKEHVTETVKTASHTLNDLMSDVQTILGKLAELQQHSKFHKKDQELVDDIEKRANELQNAARLLMEQMGALEALTPPEPPKV